MTKKPQSGDIAMINGYVFRWMRQGDRTPEIYGWVERDHTIVSKTGGFWRTADPDEAFRRCKASFPDLFEEKANG